MSQTAPFIICRLDYWLISTAFQDRVNVVGIKAAIKTDHSAISLHLAYSKPYRRGPGLWKMNTSLLTDENYLVEMEDNLQLWKSESSQFQDLRVGWDWIKYNIRRSIEYSKKQAKVKREKEETLKANLYKAQLLFHQNLH